MKNIQNNIKIIGLENINSLEYQEIIRKKVKTIFGESNSISISELKENTIFNNLIQLDKNLKDKIYAKIEELTGKEIDKYEMQALFCLLDSSSEINNGEDKESRPEKYIFDNQVNITEKTGFFKMEKDYNFEMLKTVFNKLQSIIKLCTFE